MSGAAFDPAAGFYPPAIDELDGGLGESLAAGVKSRLEPRECILWMGRGSPRSLPAIRVFPAFAEVYLAEWS